MRELVLTGGASAWPFDILIPTRCVALDGIALTMSSNEYRLARFNRINRWPPQRTARATQRAYRCKVHRDQHAVVLVRSVQRGILRPGFLGLPIRLCELVDRHLEAANDHR